MVKRDGSFLPFFNEVLIFEENDFTEKRKIPIDGVVCTSSNNKDFRWVRMIPL